MSRLLRWKEREDRKPLLLKGVRQVGKTHLLKEFGRLHYPQVHYFNFEKQPELAKLFEKDLVPTRILEDLRFAQNRSINVHEDLVIFDEIQECPKALTSLKYFQEDCPELHLCAAGSLLGVRLNPGSFPVGKVMFETLRPMSFEEFLMATDDKALPILHQLTPKDKIPDMVHEHLCTQLKHYFITGGLPESITTYRTHKDNLFEAFSLVREKQIYLLQTYYADIAKHSGKVNAMHIDRVLKAVPEQLSHVQDGSIGRFRFREVIPKISHYDRLVGAIDWLEAAELVIKVHITETGMLPFSAFAKENMFKLLLFDVGILGLMSNLSPQTLLDGDYGTFKGYFAESFVAQQLLYANIQNEKLFSWQEGGYELEFIMDVEGKAVPIEVKSGHNTKAKSMKMFAKKYNSPHEILFSGEPLDAGHAKGLQKYPLYLAGWF